MYFSDDDLKKIEDEYSGIYPKYQRIVVSYTHRDYAQPSAREFAIHGFLRRLKVVYRCIERTFEILPPDRRALPEGDELRDANINLQASVMNVYGATDNLAWVWVYEKNIARDDGSRIPNSWVGFFKKNKIVKRSLSPEFQEYLGGLENWFHNLEDYRHALAHRIPLYVPPYIVPKKKMAAYQEFEKSKADALKEMDYEGYDRLTTEQDALGEFAPIMMHSFEENAKPVVFHAQLLADFNTIEELGHKLLEELDK